MSTPSDRDIVYSHLATQIGGWNASAGIHMGHLRQWDSEFARDDAKLVRYLLDRHTSDIATPLKAEIARLKARLYDLEHPS